MASPFRELLGMISEKRIAHDNNPVLRWMASNVAGESRGGLLKPSKEKSNEKIDGITSLTMALGSAMADPVDHDTYEQGLYFA
jgi:phage terminase large subunit-like protein